MILLHKKISFFTIMFAFFSSMQCSDKLSPHFPPGLIGTQNPLAILNAKVHLQESWLGAHEQRINQSNQFFAMQTFVVSAQLQAARVEAAAAREAIQSLARRVAHLEARTNRLDELHKPT